MNYYMPTKVYIGEIDKIEFEGYGKKAFIITGKSSKKNGSLSDIIKILSDNNIDYVIYDDIEENPSMETIVKASDIGIKEEVSFIIGIGGGSPLDACKAISAYIKNKPVNNRDIFTENYTEYLPILVVPTTAGTGSETTPYAVLTDHKNETKTSIKSQIFAEKAFLNYKYFETLPVNSTLSTSIDALSHLIEGYLSKQSNLISDTVAEGALLRFSRLKENIIKHDFTKEFREEIMIISTMAGVVISSAKTSLPHLFSYNLTYYKKISHGFACGIFMCEYLKFYKEKEKVNRLLSILGFDDISDLEKFLNNVICVELEVTENDIKKYIGKAMENREKMKNHPFDISDKDIEELFVKSLS